MLVACSRCGVDHDVEDLEPSYARPDCIDDLGQEAKQLGEGPWPGRVANQLAGHPDSAGLPGVFRFLDTAQIPFLELEPGSPHPLIRDQVQGVSQAQVLEWNLALVHGSTHAG